jgi:hypothetical protein
MREKPLYRLAFAEFGESREKMLGTQFGGP